MTRKVLLHGAMVASFLALSACGGTQTGGRAVLTTGVESSIGEELTELQAAYAAGTISDTEYDRRRRAILAGAGS